jgi:hypothetical protein
MKKNDLIEYATMNDLILRKGLLTHKNIVLIGKGTFSTGLLDFMKGNVTG